MSEIAATSCVDVAGGSGIISRDVAERTHCVCQLSATEEAETGRAEVARSFEVTDCDLKRWRPDAIGRTIFWAKKRRAKQSGGSHPPVVVTSFPIERVIHTVRGRKVILDSDLAVLYQVETKALNQAVKRNQGRFPEDFVFQLGKKETKALRSQTVTSKGGRGGRRYAPYVFTEHGAIMAANVLNSQRAIEASVYVVRAFVRMRQMLAANRELAERLVALERKVGDHDEAIRQLIGAIRQLTEPPEEPKRERIGFRRGKQG